ncbi:hypothetical protein NQ317_007036 [Molorchus minor]|uniref:Uncharacterized protein n=1 Tax=Molorchus minor TaxID=1323400 RepID=A0ABQ9IZP7_9CUCU|nr:hypothetical protein NQ317_007036 [Molorchus minor]
MSIEKRNKRKEQSTTTNTTGSETEQSNSNNKERTPLNSPSRKFLEKPPTPKNSRSSQDNTRTRPEHKAIKQVIIQDLDTSISDNCYQSDDKVNQNDKDNCDNTNPGRSRKKLFSRSI